MKSAIAIGLRYQHYVTQIDGRAKSHYRRLVDALQEGLQLRDQFPQHDIKVRVMQLSDERRTSVH
jgi:hypothetical protein